MFPTLREHAEIVFLARVELGDEARGARPFLERTNQGALERSQIQFVPRMQNMMFPEPPLN